MRFYPTVANPFAALIWLRDTPHWQAAAHPEHAPTGMRLSGNTTVMLPVATLHALQGLYEVSETVSEMRVYAVQARRMFVPNVYGRLALDLHAEGVTFELGSDDYWHWSHGRRLEVGFDTLLDAVRSAGACVPRKSTPDGYSSVALRP